MALPKLSERPAETASIVAAIVAIAAIFGIRFTDVELSGVVAVVGLVASVVTYFVSRRKAKAQP